MKTGGMGEKRWEHFHHQADIGVRGIGASVQQAFEQAASAMTAVMAEPDKIAHTEAVEINCRAEDLELLLIQWLSEIIYEMATRQMLFGRFEVNISPGCLKEEDYQLTGRAWGEKIDPARHEAAVEVKAATYTELKVARKDGGQWIAQCVVDV